MRVPLIRPPVQNLIFQLYGRPLHPELFEISCEHRVRHEDYQVIVRITPTGHIISWENPDVYLTEVTAEESQSLPNKRRLLSQRLRYEQCRFVRCAHGVEYRTSFQVEQLEEEHFIEVHSELLKDGQKDGLLHLFPKTFDSQLSPLGLVRVHALPGCVFLTCFHTFPNEQTIIKSQSLIEQK